jgi:transcriptional regulator with XRE-family HTH domain
MNPNIIEKYRKKNGLSKTELASKMGKTPGWYTRIQKGEYPLPARYIAPMAEIFGIKPERLAKEYFSGHELEDASSTARNDQSASTA